MTREEEKGGESTLLIEIDLIKSIYQSWSKYFPGADVLVDLNPVAPVVEHQLGKVITWQASTAVDILASLAWQAEGQGPLLSYRRDKSSKEPGATSHMLPKRLT